MQKIDFIIPTVNRPEQFPSAIESALRLNDVAKVLVSLNGSPIEVLEKCKRVKNDKLEVIMWDKRMDIGDHWSAVVKKNQDCQYFTIVPDDDRVLDNEYYSLSKEILRTHTDVALIYADSRLLKLANRLTAEHLGKGFFKMRGKDFLNIVRSDIGDVLDICPVQFTTILNRKLAIDVGLYPNCHSPDLLLVLKMCMHGSVVIFTGQPGEYTWNANGLSLRPSLKWLASELDELDKLGKDGRLEQRDAVRLKERTQRALIVAIAKYFLSGNVKSLSQLKRIGRAFPKVAMSLLYRTMFGRWPALIANIKN